MEFRIIFPFCKTEMRYFHEQAQTCRQRFCSHIFWFKADPSSVQLYLFISAGCISYRSLYFSTAKKLQYQHSGANVDQNITCSDAIHKLVSNTFTRDDFTDINTVDDMSSERYQTLQTTLNQIRSLNSTRYLYTAKSNSEGKLIYLVDGSILIPLILLIREPT